MARIIPAPLNLWIGRHTPATHAYNRDQAPILTFCQAIRSRQHNEAICGSIPFCERMAIATLGFGVCFDVCFCCGMACPALMGRA